MRVLEAKKCVGCGVCSNVCPTKSIEMKPCEGEFLYPKINENTCIQCGMCKKICPVIYKKIAHDEIKDVYAAYSKNEENRYQSTSGGVFSELAKLFFDRGGCVAGAVYDFDWSVQHFLAETENELHRLRQSKYVQSDKKKIYCEVVKKISEGNQILFVGTPCEIYAMYNFAQMKHVDINKLFLCDFICRGANSPGIYRAYLSELETRYGSEISRVWFKNKEKSWENFSTRIEFKNGMYYSKTRDEDWYIKGYIDKCLFIRDCCEQCDFKGRDRLADFTLGDFWGIEKLDADFDRRDGVSMFMINSKRGDKIFNEIKDNLIWQKFSYEQAVDRNGCMISSVCKAVESKGVYRWVRRYGFENTMQQIYNKTFIGCAVNLYYRGRNKLRSIFHVQ